MRNPLVFLFDEPLSNLDAELRVHMRVEIAKLHKELKSTIIYVTHDQVEAMTLADKIVVLRAGVVEQVGAPLALYDDPENTFVAGFIGSPRMNFLKANVASIAAGNVTVALTSQPDVRLTLPIAASSIAVGDVVTLGVRPEHFLGQGKGDTDVKVKVDVAEHLGNTSYIYAHVSDEERIIIEHGDVRDIASRETLTVAIAASRSFLFDKNGNRLR